MRQIKVTITRTWCIHGMTMAEAIAHALSAQSQEPSRVEITAHDVFEDKEDRRDDDR